MIMSLPAVPTDGLQFTPVCSSEDVQEPVGVNLGLAREGKAQEG
jgi:hypothetical protein